MKREYNSSKSERGKYYRKGAELRQPIYLDAKLQSQVERLARESGKEIGEMVNQLVRNKVKRLKQKSRD